MPTHDRNKSGMHSGNEQKRNDQDHGTRNTSAQDDRASKAGMSRSDRDDNPGNSSPRSPGRDTDR